LIYLDNAATTSVHADVHHAMNKYLEDEYGNPSSLHGFGRSARAGLDRARKQIADVFHCATEEVIFTSGGTESVHAALFGAVLPNCIGKHVVTTRVEHHAVLHTCEFLSQLGVEVTYVQPERDGRVSPATVCAAVRPDTAVVSVMMVNNELGTRNDVAAIGHAVKQMSPTTLLHSDMVQALGTVKFDLRTLPVDLASFSAHKVHGPKGVGVLYVRKGSSWQPVLHGGAQERGRRAGTENVAGSVGFGAAVARLQTQWDAHLHHLQMVKDVFWMQLQDVCGVHKNSPEDAVPSILNVSFEGVRSDTLLMRLDIEGVAASAGSACTAGSLEPSHVLLACGVPDRMTESSIRFSFAQDTSVEDAQRAGQLVKSIVGKLRSLNE
jgi:cysteine desulfurase